MNEEPGGSAYVPGLGNIDRANRIQVLRQVGSVSRPDDHIPGEVLYVCGIFGNVKFDIAIPDGMLIWTHDRNLLFEGTDPVAGL